MPNFTIKRDKYFEINHNKIPNTSNIYCLIMSHNLKDLPEYTPENMNIYIKKRLLSLHKIYLTPKKNMIFKVEGDVSSYLKTNFKIKNADIQSIYNIYDRFNIKIYVAMIDWGTSIKLPYTNTIQLYKLNDLINTQDIYESIISYSQSWLKERTIMNDDNTIKTTFYHLYFKMIGMKEVSKYNLIKYINNT